jgi:hypothetical protein
MLKNWLLITSVTFGVGFGATMLWNKDPGQSAISGLAGVSGVAASMVLLSRQRKQELERQLQSIQVTVNILEQQELSLGKQLQSDQDNRQAVQHQVDQLEQLLANLQAKQQGQQASISKFDRDLEAKRNGVAELDAAIKDKQIALAATVAEMATAEQQQSATQSSILNLQDIEAEIAIYAATKAQLVLEIARLEEYRTEIKTQIADDKDICEKAEEYLQQIDQEVTDKREDLAELDVNIKAKVSEINGFRQQISELEQQKTAAELAITKLAIELQKAGSAVLEQEDAKYAAELQSIKSNTLPVDLAVDNCKILDQNQAEESIALPAENLDLLAIDVAEFSVDMSEDDSMISELKNAEMDLLPLEGLDLLAIDVAKFSVDMAEDDSMISEPKNAELDLLPAENLDLLAIDIADYSVNMAEDDSMISEPKNAELDLLPAENLDLLAIDIADYSVNMAEDDSIILDQENATELPVVIAEETIDLPLDLTEYTVGMSDASPQFVEFQPESLSIMDLEETSPLSARSFSELCEMELCDIGLTDIDLEDMTLDQSNLTELDDLTWDQSNIAEDILAGSEANWASSFVGNPHLQILQHIDEHGSIAHFEVTALLNDKKSAKLFGSKLAEYSQLLPFAIEVEPSKNGNKYIKKVGVLATVS